MCDSLGLLWEFGNDPIFDGVYLDPPLIDWDEL